MFPDIVIDPFALLEENCYPGKIYVSARWVLLWHSNEQFGGWLVVGAPLTGTLQELEALPFLNSKQRLPVNRPSRMRMGGPLFLNNSLLFYRMVFNCSDI